MPLPRHTLWRIPLLFSIIFATLAVSRHLCLASWSYDLGVKSQLLFNAAAGRWLESSFEVQHYFGDHLNPTFFLLTPLFWLAPSPITLIIAQCISLALAGVIVGRLAQLWLPNLPRLAPLSQAVFLFHAATQNLTLYDVHENAFAATLVLAAVLANERKKHYLTALCILLAVGCKENAGLAASAFGTWLILRNRRTLAGSLLIIAGLAWSFAAMQFVLPHYRGQLPDTMLRYAQLGNTPTDLLINLATNPIPFVRTLLHPSRIVYVLALLLPTLYLPFLRPAFLLPALWVLLPNLLSARPQQCSSLYHYDALILPFITLAMLRAWCALERRDGPRLFIKIIPRLTIAALLILCANSRVWFWAAESIPNLARRDAFAQLAATVPPDAPLTASLNLGPHLLRRQLQVYPQLDWPADRFPRLPARRAEYVFVDYAFELRHRGNPRDPQHDRLTRLGYTLTDHTSNFALYRLTATDTR